MGATLGGLIPWMAAVIAAIGAAFLAGAVALFREHRQQQRKLLVAARIMDATFGLALGGIAAARKSDRWVPVDAIPGEAPFSSAWETYKADLAGHLSWSQWVEVEKAVSRYTGMLNMSKADPPSDPTASDVVSTAEDALKKGREVLSFYCVKRFTVRRLVQRKFDRAEG